MKKRLMAALLCLCLLMGTFTAVAYAGEVIVDNLDNTSGDGYADFNLDETAEYAYAMGVDITAQTFDNAKNVAGKVYKVEIAWGDMAFAWGTTGEYTLDWKTSDHTYETSGDTRVTGWYLIDETTPLSLFYDAESVYSDVVSGTKQNYVALFNHSNGDVKANVKIADVNAPDANDGTLDDNITALLKNEDDFGAKATVVTENEEYDYVLTAAAENSEIYANDATAAALYVEMENEPAEGALNNTEHRSVARITVTLDVLDTQGDDVDAGDTEA